MTRSFAAVPGAALTVALVLAATVHVLAIESDVASVGANSFAADTLNPPTGVKADGGASVTVRWTATPDTYATGHRVFRAAVSGGPYTQIAQVTPRTTVSYVDTPGNGVFYYVVRAYRQNWESVNSTQATVTAGLLGCSANLAAPNPNNGDGNGYETTPSGACADGGSYAEDANSGTNTNTGCGNAGKDRHQYYDYGMSVPTGSTILGIEVRLDGLVTTTAATVRRLCVALSWNGGTTYTTAKQLATDMTTGETTYILGGAADNWGRTWSASELTNANFRVRVIDTANNTTTTYRLDWAAVRVTYTAP